MSVECYVEIGNQSNFFALLILIVILESAAFIINILQDKLTKRNNITLMGKVCSTAVKLS